MESPLLELPGAVPAQGPDAGVAAHYGDPFAEQRALASASGLVDRSHRGVVRITGPDRLSWLNDLTTQQIGPMPPGTAVPSLILSPQGHVQHYLTLTDDGEAVWIHVEPGTAPALLEFLESMRFMLRVEPADVSAEFAVLTLAGPGGPQAPPPGVAAAMSGAGLGTDLIVPRAELTAFTAGLTSAGATMAGMWAHEALRIAAHQARLGRDSDHRSIPHELGWIETAVHLNKGCYRGQETVARVHNLGHPPRRLVFLHLDGSVDKLPANGDPVEAGGSVVGFTGSSARHYELGPIALALVKRTVPVDAPLLAGGIDAAQEVIVAPDAGGNVTVALRRTGADKLRRPGVA